MEIQNQERSARNIEQATAEAQPLSVASENSCPAMAGNGEVRSADWDLHGIGASYFAELKASDSYTYWNGA